MTEKEIRSLENPSYGLGGILRKLYGEQSSGACKLANTRSHENSRAVYRYSASYGGIISGGMVLFSDHFLSKEISGDGHTQCSSAR